MECGEDLSKVRLEMLGSNEGKSSGLPGGNVVVPCGVGEITNKLTHLLPKNCLRLSHQVTLIDWSLLSRDPRLPDKVTIECNVVRASNTSVTTKYAQNRISNTPSNDPKEVVNADYVICTLPLGVLKSSHRKMFHPRLPDEKVVLEVIIYFTYKNRIIISSKYCELSS